MLHCKLWTAFARKPFVLKIGWSLEYIHLLVSEITILIKTLCLIYVHVLRMVVWRNTWTSLIENVCDTYFCALNIFQSSMSLLWISFHTWLYSFICISSHFHYHVWYILELNLVCCSWDIWKCFDLVCWNLTMVEY